MLAMKRRRELKTDYRNRLGLIKSGKPRLVVKRSLKGIRIQVVAYGEKGDKTLLEATSARLRKFGWKGHTGNVPAAYLTGFLLGRLASRSKTETAVADIGLQHTVKGSSLFAAVRGCRDAGLYVPVGEEILPAEERIKGLHIAEYAKKLKSENQEKYRKQFSACIKNGLDPERIPDHFDEVKGRITQVTDR